MKKFSLILTVFLLGTILTSCGTTLKSLADSKKLSVVVGENTQPILGEEEIKDD